MRDFPKISLIMPNFNGEAFISRSIQCFLEQKYADKELIIVDGKSTDKSHKIIEELVGKHKELKWIKDHDTGLCDAFNIGLKYTTGDLIGILPNDDYLCYDIFNSMAFFYKYSDFDGIYFDSFNLFENSGKIVARKCPRIEFTKFNLIFRGGIVGFENMYYTKEVYQEFQWNTSNRYCPDFEFYLRVADSNYKYFLLEMPSTINVIHDNSLGGKNRLKQLYEAARLSVKYAKGLNIIQQLLVYGRVGLLLVYSIYLKFRK